MVEVRIMEKKPVTPYQNNESKKKQVAEMFNNIAGSYDFLNHFFSLGIDIRWRKKAINLLRPHSPKKLLDIATGTGDFAFEALSLNPDHITGVDISEGMLEKGREKIKKQNAEDKITLKYGDSENLPFDENTFDAVTVSFGVRNFENLERGLQEMLRVTKPGGKIVILEFSKPRSFPFKQAYFLYFSTIMPLLGRFISKDKSAYTYLPESVKAFPDGEAFKGILSKLGYKSIKGTLVTGGIATIYMGEK